MSLVLDADHCYFWESDGKRTELLGCTAALKGVGLIDTSRYTVEAMARGTAVHRLIERTINADAVTTGDVTEIEGHPHAGYVLGALRYVSDSKLDVLHVELSLSDLSRRMAGTLDLLGLVGERFTLVDFKTGEYERWHGYQGAWYEHLARTHRLIEGLCDRATVYLRADGTYNTRPFTDRNDWKVADAARVVEQAKGYLR